MDGAVTQGSAEKVASSRRILQDFLKAYPAGIDLSLDRVLVLLDRLGNPHLKLPPVIHVAGTNGKGSVIAGLRAIYETAGYKVHVFSSPHLITFHERIRLSGALIDDDALADVLVRVQNAVGNDPITFFEATTCAAFLKFAEVPADLVLLETGMGGRLDATNVVPEPLLTVITAIGWDHVQHLGPTLQDIAAEKAGIFKPGTPCVIQQQPYEEEVMPVFESIAAEKDVALYKADLCLLPSSLYGVHQKINMGTVARATEVLQPGLPVGMESLKLGLMQIDWPGRLQNIGTWHGMDVWFDGGHNADAARALAAQMRMWAEIDSAQIHLILGMLETKDPEAFMRHLAPFTGSVASVPLDSLHAFSPEKLCCAARDLGLPAFPAENVDHALRELAARHPGGRVLVTGSLHLAAEVLRPPDMNVIDVNEMQVRP